MSASELEVLDQFLDSSRKVNRFIAELQASNPKLAEAIRRNLDKLTDQALAVYFHAENKPGELKCLLESVQSLTKVSQESDLAA